MGYVIAMFYAASSIQSLSYYRQKLGNEVAGVAEDDWDGAASVFPDVHIASACLQKALRRADRKAAHGAGEILRIADNARLWRRLTVCVFEDFGLSDLGLTAEVTTAAASQDFRRLIGERRLLHHLINRLMEAPKDRRVDDLYVLAARLIDQPSYRDRLEQAEMARWVVPLIENAVGLARSCERPVPRRSFRALSLAQAVRALEAMDLADGGLFELCRTGLRVSNCLLPLLLPLVAQATTQAGGCGAPQKMALPLAPRLGGIPAYVLDGYTRLGRQVLDLLLGQERRLQDLLKASLPKDRPQICRQLLFFAEGGRCNCLLDDGLARALMVAAVVSGTHQLDQPSAFAAVALMGELLPQLHVLRAKAVGRLTSTLKEPLP